MKVLCRIGVVLGIGCFLAASGCDPVHNGGPKFMGGNRLSLRSRWIVTGDLRNPQFAVDGNINTAAVSDVAYRNAALTIDLGKVCLFNMITVDHGSDEFGYCGKVALLVSDDGETFHPQIIVPGLRRVTTIVLVRQVLGRYVRLQAVVPGDRPWSIAEVHLD